MTSPRRISRRGALIVGAGVAVVAGAAAVGLSDRKSASTILPPPPVDVEGRALWRNWSGLQHAYPALRARPTNLEELKSILATAPGPIRLIGGGQSFTALAVTSGTLLSLDGMAGAVRWEGATAIVPGGLALGELGLALVKAGRSIVGSGGEDVVAQTIGGVLATGVHASGARIGALHQSVTGLTLLTPDGQTLVCDGTNNSEIFQAAKVSLGLLGAITEVRLATLQPQRVVSRAWSEPLAQALASAEARWAGSWQFEMRIAPLSGRAICIADVHGIPLDPELPDPHIEPTWRDLKAARDRLSWAPPLRRAVVENLMREASSPTRGRPADPPGLRYNEMEFHLPADAHLAALVEVIDAVERSQPDVFLPIRATRTASDDAWLSPFQGGPKGSIAVRAYGEDDYAFLFERIQPILLRHGGRPHWGKLHSLRGDQLAALYPRWDDFLRLRKQLDPGGRFTNLYLDGLLGLS